MPRRRAPPASALALTQANLVADALRAAQPDLEVELVEISSAGDEDQQQRIDAFGSEGIFVKALEQAVRDGKADAAVHSLKDVPTEDADGLVLAAFLKR